MIPDPNTKEGREEIARRVSKRKKELEVIKKRALEEVDDEPNGKMTFPNDLDRTKDRNQEDE